MIIFAFIGLITFLTMAFAAKRGLFGPHPGHHTTHWAETHDITALPPRHIDVTGRRFR